MYSTVCMWEQALLYCVRGGLYSVQYTYCRTTANIVQDMYLNVHTVEFTIYTEINISYMNIIN